MDLRTLLLWLLFVLLVAPGCTIDHAPTQHLSDTLFTTVGLTEEEIIDRLGPPHDIPVSVVNTHGQKIEYWTYTFDDTTSWDPFLSRMLFFEMADGVRMISGGLRARTFWTMLFSDSDGWPDWDTRRARALRGRAFSPTDSVFQSIAERWRQHPPWSR